MEDILKLQTEHAGTSLHVCAGLSKPVHFVHAIRQILLRCDSHIDCGTALDFVVTDRKS